MDNYCFLLGQVPTFLSPGQGSIIPQLFFWLLLNSFVQNSPLCSFNMSLIPQKSCITHSRSCSRVCGNGHFRKTPLAFNDFRITVYAAPTLSFLDSVLLTHASRDLFLNSITELCFSYFHYVSLHFYRGKKKITRHSNPWCL